jgi:hypothetical protein
LELLLGLLDWNSEAGKQLLEPLLSGLSPELKARDDVVGELDTLVERPVSEEHQFELLLDHNITDLLVNRFSCDQIEQIFIFVLLLLGLYHIDNGSLILVLLLVVLGWVQLGNLVIALGILLGILVFSGLAVDHDVRKSDDPPPEHILGTSIQL